jgi:hypothetical protein
MKVITKAFEWIEKHLWWDKHLTLIVVILSLISFLFNIFTIVLKQ